MSSIDFSKALHLLDKAGSILITCHTRPDGDALGSASALAQILRSKGKSAEIILPSQLPSRYAFLFQPQAPRVIQDDWLKAAIDGFDTAVVLDTSVQAQLVPQFDFLVVSSPSRKTPRVAPPVMEKILKANQRIFSTGVQAAAIPARTKPKPTTEARETSR